MRGRVLRMLWFLCCLSEIVPSLYQPAYPPQSVCSNLLLRNGKVKKRQRGRFVKFICNTGYMLAGEKFSVCNRGSWDPQPPKCVRPTCMNKANPPLNGLIYPTHSGAVMHIYCKSGYQVKGPTEVHCDGRKWDNNMPVCMKANTNPKLFCDFEDEDLCGWSHDLNHEIDWKRENYQTPSGSIGTGPSFDHTKGPGQDGHYMYMESSSRNENDTGRLISPIFEKTDGLTCLEFFYHMYGVAIGSLRVYVKKASQSWDLDPETAIFNMRGNQGDKWYRSYHSLGVIDDEYQIVIEGIRGHSYVSDIAIDDVKIIENCVFEEITTTTEEYAYTTNMPLTVESCDNRCGQTAGENETHVIPCDCDDNCYDHNKCCPDYFDFCFVGNTNEDLMTTEISNEVTEAVPHSNFVTPSTTSQKPPPSTKTVAANSTIMYTTTTTYSTSTTTTTAKPTTRMHSPTTNATTKKVVQKFVPTLKFLPQPTQPAIVRKVLTTTRVPTKNNVPEIVYVKPKKPKINEIDNNDVMEVPRPTNSDEELLLTSPLPDVKVKIKEGWPAKQDIEDPRDSPSLGNFSEKDKFFSVKEPVSGGYNVIIVAISVLGIVVLTTVVVIVLIRRYRGIRRRLTAANGDSQSDVRFLTSDEVLDFSLDKDYDSL